ncbi:SusC/RagA family TonB-linked outer membrane protein [Candidatus Palauibacter sp.]|uniref:SusC/RagA family TonB-linked outer membrane protein n=1 Tax=Candidatus Palauibacter sp. TaxID=3101350 RepID=UPI003B02254B
MLFDLSGRRKRVSALAATAVSAWLFIGAAPLLAQGAVSGTVTDAESMAPVAGVQVFVAGTVIGALSGQEGTYRLEGVPAGEQTVTVRLIGYRELSQTVTVQSGQVATADFSVQQTALRIQDIVVTGVVGETPQVKLPFTVVRLSAQDFPVPAADVSSLLTAKAAGVSVVSGSGQPGQAADILLRGPTSINADGRSQAPLIVIDGVIQSQNASLSDVGALDVDHVEIVKGAAAASLYGSRAQNGVIQITTKRGTGLQTNSLNILSRGEYGFGQLVGEIGLVRSHPYTMNAAGTKFIDSTGSEVDFRDLNRPGFGSAILYNQIMPGEPATPQTAFANQAFPTDLFNHMDTFFDPGETMDIYGAVTGRFGESSFRVSVDQFREAGVVSCAVCIDNLSDLNADRVAQGMSAFDVGVPDDEGYQRQNVRLNVDTRFGDLDIAASGFYSRADQDDRAVSTGAFSRLTFMSPAIDITDIDPSDGYPDINADPQSIEPNPLYLLAVNDGRDKRTRTMGSVDLNFSPSGLDWLTLEANASFDRTDFRDYRIRPKNERTAGGGGTGDFTGGSLREYNFTDEAINASVTLGASQTFMDGDLTVRGKARYLIEDQDFGENGVFGSRFSVQDVPNFGAIIGETSGNNEVRQIQAEGLFGIASADYRGRYILDGLIRRDGSSLFGPDERWQTYYRGSAAWRIAQEDFWNIDAIDEFKLRFSLGTAGGRPNFFAQYETFGVSAGAIFPVNLGNTALKPEFTTEREAGMNFVFFDNIGLDLTYAWQTTDDQLLQVPQPAFVGFSSQWQNAGEIAAQTYEASLRYAAIDEQDMGLQFRVNWDKTKQKITRLDVPAYQYSAFYVAEGRPLGEMWGEIWAASCADLAPVGISASDCASNFQVNDDGLLVPTGGANFTDGFSSGLWGTQVMVATEDGENSYHWGFPIKIQDYSPVCVEKNPGDYMEKCPLVEDRLPIGNTTPDFNTSFATNFRYKGLSLNALLEASVGHHIYNGTRQWSLRELRGEDTDQTGKPLEHNKPVGVSSAIYSVNADNSWFIEDGSWMKVRELSLGFTLPASIVESLFGGVFDRVTVNAIGRNLVTLTGYRGYDPEVGGGGGQLGSTAINAQDNFAYPNFRTFTFAAELVF